MFVHRSRVTPLNFVLHRPRQQIEKAQFHPRQYEVRRAVVASTFRMYRFRLLFEIIVTIVTAMGVDALKLRTEAYAATDRAQCSGSRQYEVMEGLWCSSCKYFPDVSFVRTFLNDRHYRHGFRAAWFSATFRNHRHYRHGFRASVFVHFYK
jgi:hypothetical protein